QPRVAWHMDLVLRGDAVCLYRRQRRAPVAVAGSEFGRNRQFRGRRALGRNADAPPGGGHPYPFLRSRRNADATSSRQSQLRERSQPCTVTHPYEPFSRIVPPGAKFARSVPVTLTCGPIPSCAKRGKTSLSTMVKWRVIQIPLRQRLKVLIGDYAPA